LPEIVAIYERENQIAELERALKSLIQKHPEMSTLVAYTASGYRRRCEKIPPQRTHIGRVCRSATAVRPGGRR
jgi:predicted RNA-binding protein